MGLVVNRALGSKTNMRDYKIINWLLDSDVSIQYQVYRDLLNSEKPELKDRISKEGWGRKLLSLRKDDGHWGLGFYQPKWISSHYTLLDLRNLEIANNTSAIRETIKKIIDEDKGDDGGINPSGTIKQSDVCINGMFLNYASYFKTHEKDLKSVIDFIISQQLPDGGFNCQFNRKGASHSSLHSTLSVIEGIQQYSKSRYIYRLQELQNIENLSREFILLHKLYKSHRTGDVIDKRMLMLSYPCRWRFDILRALDYFQFAKADFDPRMSDAINVLIGKQRADYTWPLQAKHAGMVHFEMEKPGKPGRWNTLRALRVLKHFGFLQSLMN